MAKASGVSSSTASEYINVSPTLNEKKVDFVLFHPHFDNMQPDRTICYDPTIVNPFSASISQSAFIKNPSNLFDRPRREKINKYNDLCTRLTRVFIPLIINTYGNISTEVTKLLDQLALKHSEKFGSIYSTQIQHLHISFMTLLYRFNASIIIEGLHAIQLASSTILSSSSSEINQLETPLLAPERLAQG
jgi:hypothetical protein